MHSARDGVRKMSDTGYHQLQLVVCVIAGALAITILLKLVAAFIYSLWFLVPIAMLLKPDIQQFRDFLILVEKGTSRHHQRSRTMTGMLHQVSTFFVDPARGWQYINLGVCILARRARHGHIAIGIYRHWILLDLRSSGYKVLSVVVSVLPEGLWAPIPGRMQTAHRNKRQLEHWQQALSSAIEDVQPLFAEAQFPDQRRASVPSTLPLQLDIYGKSTVLQGLLEEAQALAESGRFEEAGRFVRDKILSLHAQPVQQIRLHLLAAAFFETGKNGFLDAIACTREAAKLQVQSGKHREAADSFQRCATMWHSKAASDSNFALISDDKIAPLMLSCILCQLSAGDLVEAGNCYREAVEKDPGVKETPEGGFLTTLLVSCQKHNAQGISEARARLVAERRTLESWQGDLVQMLAKRIDAGCLK